MAEQEETKKKSKPKVNKIFVAVRQLPNGSTIKIEQSETFNVKVSVSNGEKSDAIVMTPQVANTLHELLGGCLKSKP